MIVKIQCACGSKYSFEVEPRQGRMPAPVQCPACGADGTAAANNILAAVPTRSAASDLPDGVIAPIRVAGSRASASASTPMVEGSPRSCPRHPTELSSIECFVCQKPMCNLCLEQFGYVCSVYCREQAQKQNLDVPVFAGQRLVRGAVADRRQGQWLRMAAFVALVMAGLWIWYRFFGSKPRLELELATMKTQPFSQAVWLDPESIVVLSREKLAARDVGSGKELWSSKVESISDERMGGPLSPHLVRGRGGVWLAQSTHAALLDPKTGKVKTEFPFPQPVQQLAVSEEAIVAVCQDTNGRVLIRIDLATGQRESVGLASEPAGRSVLRTPTGSPEFTPADGSVVQLATKLLESRIVSREAMKPRGPSVLESGSLRASDSTVATEEFLNQSQRERTGGIEQEDESRYQVTLTRHFAASSPWTGEVVGPPWLFPQKTVDAVVANTTLLVFGKSNQKLWEAKLTYTISPRFRSSGEAEGRGPAREIGNQLYVADQGMLTAFNLKSGQVLWRVTTVGISDVVPDSSGNLYVTSTTAGPESIKYSQEISLTEKIHPLLLKVERSSGRVLWQTARLADQCFVSGKFVYAARGQVSRTDQFIALQSGGDSEAPIHHRIYRVDPARGNELWEYYRPKVPMAITPNQNRILLLYPDEVRVLRFQSF